jgi:hypothetical protein
MIWRTLLCHVYYVASLHELAGRVVGFSCTSPSQNVDQAEVAIRNF